MNTALHSYNQWYAQTITYTFNSIGGNRGNLNATNYQLFNETQQTGVKVALGMYEEVINVKFIEVASIGEADIVFRSAILPGSTPGWSFFPSESDGTDVTLDLRYDSFEPGQFNHHLLMHELGHAMGLAHPLHDGYNRDYSTDETIMSYNEGDYATRGFGSAPIGLQVMDIETLQSLYGANHNHNAGNDSYFLTGETKIFTLWDGNGIDTINASNYLGHDIHIDISEGTEHITTVGNTHMWIAKGANIENVIGTHQNDNIAGNHLDNEIRGRAGNDTIKAGYGNDIIKAGRDNDNIDGGFGNEFINGNSGFDTVIGGAGNDTLHGGREDDFVYGNEGNDIIYGDKGNDILSGGEGFDTFIFTTGSNYDIVSDFVIGEDTLHVSSWLYSSEEVLLNHVSYANGNARIDLGFGDEITLIGIGDGTLGVESLTILK